MNQNFYNSNSSGFDQFQPPQYSDVHQPPEEISIEELKTMMQSYCEIMSQRREQEAILLQEQAVKEKQELLAEEQAANPSEPSPVSYFYNADCDNISIMSTTYTIHLTKSATIITNPSEPTRHIYHNHDIFYDGDDDEELFPNEHRDEHLSTISKTESDELIKSSVKNLVPTPSESEDFSDIESECDVPVCDNFTTFSNPLFDADDDFSSSDDESFSDEDEEIRLVEKLLYDNSSPRPPKEFNSKNSDAIIEYFSPFPIPVEDSDSLMEEIGLFLTSDDSMPPGIENDDYDSEGDILFLEELLSNDSPSLPKNESFHFDVPSFPRPPAKPPDDGIYFEPNTGILTAKVVGDISKHYVLMPRLLPTPSPMFDTLLLFSSENEDKVHLLSHRGFKAFQLFSESPMMIYGGNIPTLDVPYIHFYPPLQAQVCEIEIAPGYEASRARGFVLRSLELQSLA
ncbi:hypothetical protein Tco_1445143 [Tanacetum coccineum]